MDKNIFTADFLILYTRSTQMQNDMGIVQLHLTNLDSRLPRLPVFCRSRATVVGPSVDRAWFPGLTQVWIGPCHAKILKASIAIYPRQNSWDMKR